MVMTFFFIQTVFSFLFLASDEFSCHFLLRSLFWPRSEKYFRGTLYTCFSSICRPNFPILSSRLLSVLSPSLCGDLMCRPQAFCLTKYLFQSFLTHFLANVLAWRSNTCKFPAVQLLVKGFSGTDIG